MGQRLRARKLNILLVQPSHSRRLYFGIHIGRVSGVPSDSDFSDTKETGMCRRFAPFLPTIRNLFRVDFRAFPLQLLLILIASGAWAQDASTGALRGVVLDAQGAAITSADIVAIRVETGIRYHSATDSAGRFVMELLPPGQYSARAEAEGLSPQISPVLQVEVGAATNLTFRLKVAGPKEMISVSEAPRILEANPSSVSALLDERAINDLPLNGRRFTDLLLLTPARLNPTDQAS